MPAKHTLKAVFKQFCLLMIFLLPRIAIAQPPADSIRQQIESHQNEDSSLARMYIDLATVLFLQNPDSAKLCLQRSLAVSRKSGYIQGVAECLNNLGYIAQLHGQLDSALALQQRSLSIKKKIPGFETGVAAGHMNIGGIYYYQGRHEDAFNEYGKALDLAIKIDHKWSMAMCYQWFGFAYGQIGRLNEGLEATNMALEIQKELGDQKAMADSYSNLSNIKELRGELKEAIDYIEKSVAIRKELGDFNGLAVNYNNMANIYGELGNREMAIELMNEAYELNMEVGNIIHAATNLMNIGHEYLILGDLDKAEEFNQNGFDLHSKSTYWYGMAHSNVNLARVKIARGQHEQAENYLKDALNYARKGNLKDQESYASNELAKFYLMRNKINEAIKYGEIGYQTATQVGIIKNIQEASLVLKDAYRKAGNHEKAFFYFEKYQEARDSLSSTEHKKLLANMAAKYESEKKEAEIKLLNKDKEAQQAELNRQKLQRNTMMGGLLMLLLFILYFIRNNRTLLQKNVIIKDQLGLISKQKEHITDSIAYASRIQQALLPPLEEIKASFPDHFVLYRPRDIVSGDFYWLKRLGNYSVFTVADCTGHGVPGAFMSMLGVAFLNEITAAQKELDAAALLNALREKVKSSLRQTGAVDEAKDGMDMALGIINHQNMELQFAGAYNPIWLIRNGELMEIKASRNPVSWFIKEKPFENKQEKLLTGDLLYLFSDGFADQIGGPKRKKFMSKNFKKFLSSIHNESMPKQQELLITEITNWMEQSNTQQMDDICVMGIKL